MNAFFLPNKPAAPVPAHMLPLRPNQAVFLVFHSRLGCPPLREKAPPAEGLIPTSFYSSWSGCLVQSHCSPPHPAAVSSLSPTALWPHAAWLSLSLLSCLISLPKNTAAVSSYQTSYVSGSLVEIRGAGCQRVGHRWASSLKNAPCLSGLGWSVSVQPPSLYTTMLAVFLPTCTTALPPALLSLLYVKLAGI